MSGPFIARLGGLPVTALTAFSSSLETPLGRIEKLEAELAAARQRLVERLYGAIGDPAYDGCRRWLLDVKRASHNGRPLDRWRGSPSWPQLAAASGGVAAEVLRLEDELVALRQDFAEGYEAQRLWELSELARWTEDPFFRCGLAVASPVAARESRRLAATPPERHGRRERRLVPTVLRYLSRAAFKLSPFSTFTPVARGAFVDGAGAAGYELLPGEGGASPARYRSLVRLRRHLLDRCLALLERLPAFRDGLRLAVNDSITALEDGDGGGEAGGERGGAKLCWLRPSRWQVDRQGRRLRFVEECLVKLRPEGPLFAAVAELAAAGPTYGELVAGLAARLPELGGRDRARHEIDALLEIGWLVFVAPWPSDAGHLEERLLELLRRPFAEVGDAAWGELVSHVTRLVELQAGLLEAAHPERSCRELGDLVGELLEAGRQLVALDGVDVAHRSSEHDLYQDVWQPGEGGAASVRLDRATARSLLDDVRPLVRYAHLFDHRLELRRTLGELCRRSGPRPVLALFAAARAHFQDFMRFSVRSRRSATAETWNPLELDDLTALEGQRAAAAETFAACVDDVEGEGRRLRGGELTAYLDRLPAVATAPFAGACLFLQPASTDGSLWVLNRMKEGTGRFGSRYSPVMDAASRRAWTEGLGRRGRFPYLGEEVELVDVRSIQGDTLNVHDPQTPRLLTPPGWHGDLAAGRRLCLAEVWVHAGADGHAVLRDRDGRRLLPVHLGVGYLDYMPTLFKFLCAFGPSELGAIFPRPWARRQDGLVVSERTLAGRVVLARRSWRLAPRQLLAELGDGGDGGGDARAFATLTGWRRRHGVPRRVFAREPVDHPIAGRRYRPQYLDLTSPSFVRLLRSLLEASPRALTLFEVLPAPEAFKARALEVLLDELALGPEVETRHDLSSSAPSGAGFEPAPEGHNPPALRG